MTYLSTRTRESDDLDHFVSQAAKYAAKAAWLAKERGEREFSAVLFATLRMYERNDYSAPQLQVAGRGRAHRSDPSDS